MATSNLSRFIERQRQLLSAERQAEIERSSLLLSNCGPKLLEHKGLALLNLGVASINIGLGGKTLVELERPSAHHASPIFPLHTLRTGDLACIEANVTSTPKTKGASKKQASTTEYKGKVAEGVVYKMSDTRITVAVDTDEELDLPDRLRLVKLANNVTYDRMDKAIDTLEKITSDNPPDDKAFPRLNTMHHVLLGQASPSAKVAVNDLEFLDPTLNDSQKDAIRFCLGSPEVACIHGPPGTGKTHTLIELIWQLCARGQRLLVCGASNLAVDNILERLLALPADSRTSRLKVTRVGHPARVMANEDVLDATLEVQAGRTDAAALAKDVKAELEAALGVLSGKGKGAKGKAPRGLERKKMWDEVKALRKEYRQREGGVVKSVLSEAQVVLATCHTAGNRQLRSLDFDTVIIDEATQAVEAVCWVPIFKAKKLVLAGDPMQLPPTILSIDKKGKDKKQRTRTPILRPPRTLETTLFDRLERMHGPSIKRMLKVQYRMHEDICAFPSKALYGGKLQPDPSVAKRLLRDLPSVQIARESAGIGEDEDDPLASPVVFFDTAGCEYYERLEGDNDEGSRCNENEATIVKGWVGELTQAGVLPSQIAVITPYQAQLGLLTSLLRPLHGPDLEIGTVDGMQGREKEAVIISMVRSNDKREVGFLKEKRRMNVAMTRAKRQLCVVGDSGTVAYGGTYLKEWLAWLEAHADVRYGGLD
ncbi:P-loop containing nucleoside triphosphate hydrolase protein [Schizophyllum commune H4-8]|uniref:DNA helicase n=1 Tax=Schizophyllum commune (strain H4-8 / FGSC 9210) TaxID=578458 RepID=D8QBX7_SCHCM|nr:P-loop containing nucleoside triphosphate hydrolase protein [Schizophyllum commune H4-8]KAI5889355.1 P-loop containing nucleoside triphosphate hydrolase protein [Schizophyllum commune H4-8]